jgi:acetyl-CoA acetyltransferase
VAFGDGTRYGQYWRVGGVAVQGRAVFSATAFGGGSQRLFVAPEPESRRLVTIERRATHALHLRTHAKNRAHPRPAPEDRFAMLTLRSTAHRARAPESDFFRGERVPCFESPARAEIVVQAMQSRATTCARPRTTVTVPPCCCRCTTRGI